MSKSSQAMDYKVSKEREMPRNASAGAPVGADASWSRHPPRTEHRFDERRRDTKSG